MSNFNINRWLRIAAIAILTVGIWFVNIAYSGSVLAADNYSAETDTYQETCNPNRVDSTKEELAKSTVHVPEETAGKSIYERVVERVDSQKEAYTPEKTKTKAER